MRKQTKWTLDKLEESVTDLREEHRRLKKHVKMVVIGDGRWFKATIWNTWHQEEQDKIVFARTVIQAVSVVQRKYNFDNIGDIKEIKRPKNLSKIDYIF